jgi:hypothetical protein
VHSKSFCSLLAKLFLLLYKAAVICLLLSVWGRSQENNRKAVRFVPFGHSPYSCGTWALKRGQLQQCLAYFKINVPEQ